VDQRNQVQKVKEENINMGKFLVKIGLKIQEAWCGFQCWWNWLVSKAMFKVESCPNKLCTCKK
jgi:hypothetical protein